MRQWGEWICGTGALSSNPKQVGEELDLASIDSQHQYRRGCVNQIDHYVHGDIQAIVLFVL